MLHKTLSQISVWVLRQQKISPTSKQALVLRMFAAYRFRSVITNILFQKMPGYMRCYLYINIQM